jgi:GDP-D-mannose 3', 5'-epimerase
MKHAIVCGAGGFIGHHLVKRLKAENYCIRAIDRKKPEFESSPADEFLTYDLRWLSPSDWMLQGADEIYQLAAEMGGMGFIGDPKNDAMIMHNSTRIHLNILEAARRQKVQPKVFFSSSACVYSDPDPAIVYAKLVTPAVGYALREDDAYPAEPDSEYGWEKLYAERLYAAYGRCYGLQTRIARIHNCYGPLGTWRGGREKAPAALCRKVAEAPEGGTLEIWGDGSQTRSFMFIDDCIEGIRRIMEGGYARPFNLGSSELVSIQGLAGMIMRIANKLQNLACVTGADKPIGVQGRNSDNTLIHELLGWEPATKLYDGLLQTYPWIAEQVALAREPASL